MDTNLFNLIANVGFPIFIAMFLLVRLEGKLEKLSDSIVALAESIKGR